MHSLLVSTHIIAGTAALAVAVLILLTKKGDDRHRSLGKLFVISGRTVLVSAIISATWGVVAVDSFIGEESVSPDARAAIRLFLGLLGVLALLTALDLENGVRAIRGTSATLTDALGVASSLTGLTVAVWAVTEAVAGRGPLSWLAVVVGWFGIEAGIKQRRGATAELSPVVAHLTGMIAASSGFLAAFGLFGLGRILPVDLFDGDAIAMLPVIVAVGGGHLLTRWWARRVELSSPGRPASETLGDRVLPRE